MIFGCVQTHRSRVTRFLGCQVDCAIVRNCSNDLSLLKVPCSQCPSEAFCIYCSYFQPDLPCNRPLKHLDARIEAKKCATTSIAR